MRDLTRRFLISIFSIMLSSSLSAVEKTSREEHDALYHVTTISGFVVIRRFFSQEWVAVSKGAILYRDDTLMVGEHATVQLRSVAGGHSAGAQKELTIHRSFVSRIDENMVRRVKVSVYFDKSFEKVGSNQKAKGGGFREAWNQVMALRFSDFLGTITGNSINGVTLGIAAKPIVITSPWDDQVIYVNSFPQNLRFSWIPPRAYKVGYKVYLWNANEARPESPRDSTEQPFYTARFEGAGVYNVQVSSPDGDWQSKVLSFSIEINKPAQTRHSLISGDDKITAEIQSVFPPRHFLTNTSEVEFYWSLPFELREFSAQIEIQGADGSSRDYQEQAGRILVKLDPGKYFWRVKRSRAQARSEWRELTVNRPINTADSGPFATLWKARVSAVTEWNLPSVTQ
ncbi:MAG: hypothetical protein H7318_07960 [Oligoflexus sp.]|nr:hypothetical protein [Oligoflexus sp.]